MISHNISVLWRNKMNTCFMKSYVCMFIYIIDVKILCVYLHFCKYVNFSLFILAMLNKNGTLTLKAPVTTIVVCFVFCRLL